MNKVALYCRSGFEKECAAEITAKAAKMEIFGFARVKEDSGYVLFECYQPEDADRLAKEIPFRELIFARQLIVVGELLKDLPPEDRVSPIVGMLHGVITNGGELRVEMPDTNESKELTKFCRKLTVPLRSAMREQRILGKRENPLRPVVHVFFIADRKSTRLNPSHTVISYAVFCLKKKNRASSNARRVDANLPSRGALRHERSPERAHRVARAARRQAHEREPSRQRRSARARH